MLGRDFRGDFIFKGGTSLSKGYRLVERFSEDIDVLVLPGERGGGATDKLMKAMADAAAADIGGSATRGRGERDRPAPLLRDRLPRHPSADRAH